MIIGKYHDKVTIPFVSDIDEFWVPILATEGPYMVPISMKFV